MKVGKIPASLMVLSAALAIAVAAGAAFADPPAAPAPGADQTAKTDPSPQPVPHVEDCAIVSVSSPFKYACNGKVYTSFQLQKLREAEAARAKAGY